MTAPKVTPSPAVSIPKPDEMYPGFSEQLSEDPLFPESVLRRRQSLIFLALGG